MSFYKAAHGQRRYNSAYVATYLGDYHLHPFWQPKLAENRRQLEHLLRRMEPHSVWLDLCCGAAQHFSQARADMRCIGLDASKAQIAAALHYHDGVHDEFVVADVRSLGTCKLPKADLITVFWGALSYLPSTDDWRRVLATIAAQLDDGGRLYIENPSVAALPSFNHSSFASATGFCVLDVQPDAEPGFYRWTYTDRGDKHALLTPDVQTLLAILATVGLTARCDNVVQTLQQIIAYPTAARA